MNIMKCKRFFGGGISHVKICTLKEGVRTSDCNTINTLFTRHILCKLTLIYIFVKRIVLGMGLPGRVVRIPM